MATSCSEVRIVIIFCRSYSNPHPWSNLSTDSCMMHICFVLGDSSSSIIAVSRILIVMAVTFEVNIGLSSSSMLMICVRSSVVAVAIFCCSCILVLVVAAGLPILIAAVSLTALVMTDSFPVHGVLGPFWIRWATSCWTSGVIVWGWPCVAQFSQVWEWWLVSFWITLQLLLFMPSE